MSANHSDKSHSSHGSAGQYAFGFLLSVVLTAVPFVLTMTHSLPSQWLVPAIVGLGLVQIVVHLVYFLHMQTGSSQLWNNAAFVFTLVIVGILIVGTLWVMYHMNANMMPGMMPVE